MANPFVYGEIVPRAAFVDREVELDRLIHDLGDSQKVFLISPRRYGKSSLVREALRTLAHRQVATLEITVASFSSYVAFLEGYTRALAALDTPRARTRSWVRDLFPGIAPDVRVDPARAGGLSLSFPNIRTPRDAARLADEVFALPARIAERIGRRIVVALDEFQAIGSFDAIPGAATRGALGAGGVEQALRAAVQQQREVGYVFAGSEPSLMEQMVGPRRPFYKAGPVMRLGRIPPDTFAAFVERQFRKTDLTPEAGLGAAVVDLAGNLPYDVQRLAHELWDDTSATRRRTVTVDDLHATLHRLLLEQDTLFEATWQRLTLAQRGVLRAVVLEQGSAMLAADTRVRYRLGAASSVQTALAALQRLDVIAREDDGRYVVVDSLMREWVARKTY